MATDANRDSPLRKLTIYLMVVLFVCVCAVVLISQRLEIARRGRYICNLHQESVRLRGEQCYLTLDVARHASYKTLLDRAQRMRINLVPPEKIIAGDD